MAGRHCLHNLTVVVDRNGIQGSDFTRNVLPIDALIPAAQCAGWMINTVDGHDAWELEMALSSIQTLPHLIIADTIKGKGVSYMENAPKWHATWPDVDHVKQALEELQ